MAACSLHIPIDFASPSALEESGFGVHPGALVIHANAGGSALLPQKPAHLALGNAAKHLSPFANRHASLDEAVASLEPDLGDGHSPDLWQSVSDQMELSHPLPCPCSCHASGQQRPP